MALPDGLWMALTTVARLVRERAWTSPTNKALLRTAVSDHTSMKRAAQWWG
jgi:hypothetical protein